MHSSNLYSINFVKFAGLIREHSHMVVHVFPMYPKHIFFCYSIVLVSYLRQLSEGKLIWTRYCQHPCWLVVHHDYSTYYYIYYGTVVHAIVRTKDIVHFIVCTIVHILYYSTSTKLYCSTSHST